MLALSEKGAVAVTLPTDTDREQIVLLPSLGRKNQQHHIPIKTLPTSKRIIHIARNDRSKVLALCGSGDLYLHSGVADSDWLALEDNILLNSRSKVEARFLEDSFLLVVASPIAAKSHSGAHWDPQTSICNVSLIRGEFRPLSDATSGDIREWVICHRVYSIPLSPSPLISLSIAIRSDLAIICLGNSYLDPRFNELNFVCSRNGKISKTLLEKCGCPVSDPTEKESRRYGIVDIHFSVCGHLVTGLTQIGSMFAVSVLGSLLPLLSAQNGFGGGNPTKFLPISPHITG